MRLLASVAFAAMALSKVADSEVNNICHAIDVRVLVFGEREGGDIVPAQTVNDYYQVQYSHGGIVILCELPEVRVYRRACNSQCNI